MDKTYGSAVPQAPSLDEMRLELQRREPKIDYLEVAKDLGGQLKDQTVKEVRSLAEPRGVTDVINKGYIAALLGIPADLGNLPLQAIDALTGLTNYPTKLAPEVPTGGSKWWGNKMTDAGMATSTERPVLEIASSFLSPRFATRGAELTGKALEAGAKSLAPKFGDMYESGQLTAFPFSSPETRNFYKPALDIFAGEKAVGAGALKAAKQRATQNDANGALESIRTAGRIAHEEQAPVRAAKDAEVAEQMANLPARNKKANEDLGLYHPIGGGIKLSRPPSGMHSTTVADPVFNPPEIGIITPEQLVKEQAALFPLVGDRAAGGRYLTHVGENELEIPVRLTAGPRYMDANYNHIDPEQSAGWESGAGRVTALSNQAQRAGQDGRPVYGIYTAGSATNTDFNVMGANALIQQIPFSKITKKAERAFDLAMINGTKDFPPLPDWPGIRSPKAREMLLDKSNGIARTKLFGTMGQKEFQAMGFPDVPATRKAIIEPELLDVPTNQAGFRLARMDTTGRIIENPIIPSDYPVSMGGKVAGQLDVPADYKDIFQSHFDARRLLSQPVSGDYYSFSRAHPIQYADDDWLNRLMEQRRALERKIKLGEYAEGGAVQTEDDLDAIKLDMERKSTKHSKSQQPSPIEMEVEMMERGHG